MPALRTTPARLPHLVPHLDSATAGAPTGTTRRAGAFVKVHAARAATSTNAPAPQPESLECLAHDLRNVFSSLLLYGHLLSAPGVLGPQHSHFAPELESMTQNAAALMEKILALAASHPAPSPSAPRTLPVTDLPAELRRMHSLLAAIAGPTVKVSLAASPSMPPIRLAVEDLTRIMVNLIRNAADAMPAGGEVHIAAQCGNVHRSLPDGDCTTLFEPPSSALLTVSDNGPGIPPHLRSRIFDTGVTTRQPSHSPGASSSHRRGLGLSTVRQLIESAGGTISLAASPERGARFQISLPLAPLPHAKHYFGNTNEATCKYLCY
jgi:signal transduction histidine kinase